MASQYIWMFIMVIGGIIGIAGIMDFHLGIMTIGFIIFLVGLILMARKPGGFKKMN